MTPTRVLLVDDDRLTRNGLSQLLVDTDITVVGEAADGADALDCVASLRPDIVLMDIKMPTMDGVEATRRIVEGQDGRTGEIARVVMLTTYHTDAEIQAALRAGASGYVLKDAPDQIMSAVRAVAAGG